MAGQETISFSIRDAAESDAASILDIYAPHVLDGAVTFETEVPTVQEMASRIRAVSADYPYFTAEDGTGVIGYAYAGRVRSRDAYQWSAELSIYVREDSRGRGVGGALVRRIIGALKTMGVKTLYAVITSPNPQSEAFHERLGFKRLCVFERMGYKQGLWRDVLWAALALGEYDTPPEPIRPYGRTTR